MTNANEHNESVPQEWELPLTPVFEDLPVDTMPEEDALMPTQDGDIPSFVQEDNTPAFTDTSDSDSVTAYEDAGDAVAEASTDEEDPAFFVAAPDEPPAEDEVLTPTAEPATAAKGRRVDNVFDFVELAVFTLIVVLTLTVFLFRHSIVDGGSMESTLQDGDHLLISSLFYTPEAGDIIVFEETSAHNRPLVKRIIATEGQTVEILSDTEVYVDGEPVIGGYVDGVSDYVYPITCTVSEGCVFVLGDHRNNSADSRRFGEIPVECILGKVLIRFYPFDSFGTPGELPKGSYE